MTSNDKVPYGTVTIQGLCMHKQHFTFYFNFFLVPSLLYPIGSKYFLHLLNFVTSIFPDLSDTLASYTYLSSDAVQPIPE